MLRVWIAVFSLTMMAHSKAEWVSPWSPGEDLDAFTKAYCVPSGLPTHIFPTLPKDQREGLTKLLTEMLWADVSDYILNVSGASTGEVISRLQQMGRPVSQALVMVHDEAKREPNRSRFVYAHNRNVEVRDLALARFKKLSLSSSALAGAMMTYMECATLENAQRLDPVVQSRIQKIKAMRVQVLPSRDEASGEGDRYPRGSSDGLSGCRCGSGSFCYGPRGGRYCVTSGGNKSYQ